MVVPLMEILDLRNQKATKGSAENVQLSGAFFLTTTTNSTTPMLKQKGTIFSDPLPEETNPCESSLHKESI